MVDTYILPSKLMKLTSENLPAENQDSSNILQKPAPYPFLSLAQNLSRLSPIQLPKSSSLFEIQRTRLEQETTSSKKRICHPVTPMNKNIKNCKQITPIEQKKVNYCKSTSEILREASN